MGLQDRVKVNIRMPSIMDKRAKAIEDKLRRIKNKIVVMSGKGGVGKSFISSSIALLLAQKGFKVGLLDIDFHGPSTPKMLGIAGGKLYVTADGIEPVEGPLGIKVMSIYFMLPQDDAPVIWRGPLKTGAILQFITDVNWGELDWIVIDTPPGTGDEHLTIAQNLPPVDGAIFVTIPSEISVNVVSRSVNFALKVGIKPLGVIENMASFYCPESGKVYRIFGTSSGQVIAERYGIEFLGEVPLDPRIAECNEEGKPFVLMYPDSEATKNLVKATEKIIEVVGKSKEK